MKRRHPLSQESAMHRGETPSSLKNKKRSVELSGDIDHSIEQEAKREIMKLREVVLEQDRLVDILLDKVEHLQDDEKLDEYCKRLGVSEGVKQDLRLALPDLIAQLKKGGDIFPPETLIEEADGVEQMYQSLSLEAKKALTEEQSKEIVKTLIQGEIDLALQVLSESRERKVLSHRARGFGKDEASKEALETILTERIAEVEFDIRFTKDRRAVIHHNSSMGESAGKSEFVKDLTLEEMEGVPYKNGEQVCSLEAFFKMVKETGNNSTKINIDIKDFGEQELDEILDLIHSHNMEHRVALVSWLPQSLQYLYEKDPTLEYSMSYFPIIRGVPKFIIDLIERIPSGSRLFGKVGTEFAKTREGVVQGVGAENIASATILQSDEPWEQTMERMEKMGETLVGRHTVPHAELPVADEWGDMSVTARMLQHGSVNIMALEPFAKNLVERLGELPGVGSFFKEHEEKMVSMICGTDAFLDYAKNLQTNGVKVNIFDITEDGYIDQHVQKMKKAGVEPGIVYYSGKYEGLNTRDQVPAL